MKRIRKWLAFTIAFVMLVNTSYVQSLPVFATELQTDSQSSVGTDSDSVESVSEDTGNLEDQEDEVISESTEEGNQSEAGPEISDQGDSQEASEDSAEGTSEEAEGASEKESTESSNEDMTDTESVREESADQSDDTKADTESVTDSAAAASEKEEDAVIPNVRTQYEAQGAGLTVTAELSDPEAVPDDAELIVEELESPEGELSYALYFKGIPEDEKNKKLGEEPIQLDLESGSVKIRMAFSGEQLKKVLKAKAGSDLAVYNADGEQVTAVVSLEEEQISFDMTSLLRVRIVNQRYGVKEESKRVRYATTSDGVKVTAVLTDAAAIPDDAELAVTKIGESESELVYDISFMGPEKDEFDEPTGNTIKYEPENGTVSVTMEFLEQQLTEKLGVEDASELTVIHIPDGEAPESVETTVSLGSETIAFELESFSTLIIGKSTDDPNPFIPPEDHDSFEDNGGTYEVGSTIQYLLEHYQIIMSGNAKLDTHCMGSVLIGGDLTGSGSGFADDLKSAQTVSSYIGGSVADFTGTSASRNGNKDLAPLYVGSENVIVGIDTSGYPNYTVAGKPNYNQTDSHNMANNVYTSDNYVDWDRLYDVIREESQMLLEQGATGRPAVSDDGRVLTITAGQYVTIESLEGVEQINIIGDITVAVNTLINILDAGEINMPMVTINGSDPGTGESGAGTAYVWNIPNATRINLPSRNFLGHLIAPDAFIKQTSGQYTGGFIAKEIETAAEGHSYWYNGGKLIGDEEGFAASKVFAGDIWPEGTSYTIQMTAVTEGAPLPGHPTVTLTKDNYTAEFGDLHFRAIEGKTGTETYYYRVSEIEPANAPDDIIYDTSYYDIAVDVLYSGEGHDWRATITETRVSKDGGDWGVITAGKRFTFGFTNQYDISTTASLKATKVIGSENWDWGRHPNAEFTFQVTPNPGSPMPDGQTVLEATATYSNPTAIFDEITFDTIGTYSYVIKEVVPTGPGRVPGIVYDETEHYAFVNVDYINGELVATVTYDGSGTDLEITNTYRSVKADIKATKEFNDWGKANSFQFTLSPVTENAPMPARDTAVATEASPIATFRDIEFTEAGVYEYTITEYNDGVEGVTYDTTPHNVTVTVETVGPGRDAPLRASVTYDGNDSLTITNEFKACEATIEATKDFNDWGKANSFTFNLVPVTEGAPMPAGASVGTDDAPPTATAVATESNPTAGFGTISYDKVGEYEYTITEVNDGVAGVTYDTAPHTVVVTVSKDPDTNALSAEVKYDGADSLTITNTYSSTTATIEATKNFNDWGKAASFTFKLKAVTAGAPMPANTEVNATETNPKAVFGEITYETAGTYKYTITEQDDGVDGVSYDTAPHEVVVTVTKNPETNELSAEVTYDGADSLTITNKYESTKATIEATKDFADWGKADSFTFNLEAVTANAPMPANTTAVATQNNTTAVFGEITYEQAGEYEYTITEVNDGADGVTYDTTPHRVVVTVTKADDATNKLTAVVKYDDDADSLTITNTYASTKAEIKTTKQFNDWGKADSFTFNLAAVTSGAPMPENTTAVATKDAVDAVFGEITFEKAGEYKYTITEVNDGVDGVTYDTTPHEVVVTVTKAEDDTNALAAEVKYDGADSLIITNTFAGSKTTLQATKSFNDWGKADSFTFNLAAVTEGAPMPANTTAVATKDATTAVFGEVEYDTAGTYEYTITEVNDGVDGVTYDTTPHKVVVTVTKDDDNKLTAVAKYDDGADSLIVTNTYESTKAEIEVTKAFEDWGKADSFTFNLAAVSEDAPMPASVTGIATKENPTVSFGEIEYEKTGTYEYTITEVNDGKDGVTYDITPHNVVVTVTKDENNKMTAEVSYDDADSLIVTNTYKSTKAVLEAEKNFNDWGKAKSFTFNLEAETPDAPMPENPTAVATESNKKAVFDEIIYEKAGVYEYTITEVNDGVDGVSYDTTPHKVVVTVTKSDDEKNELTAEVKYDGVSSLLITNNFTSAKAAIEATKEFEDWGKADSFTFNLEAVTKDAPMPAVTAGVATKDAPKVVFGEVEFDKAGTYVYTITEVNDGVDGVTYDTTPHAVVVTVTKDENTNKLTAEVKYDDEDSLTITNTYASTKAEIKATKQFNDWGKADSFTFNLAAVTAGAPMPENTTAVATKDAVDAVFGEITFEKAGEYKYTITEVNDGVDGVTYDTAPHEVVVTVTKAEDDTNALTAEVKYDGKDSLIITNTFAGSKTTLQATKSFNDWGKADSFTFNLEAVTEGAPMPANTTAVATKDATTAVFGEVEYDTAGTYEYTITEVNDGVDGVTYDTTPHKVVVTVTKDDDNKLTAVAKYDNADSLIVTNTYESTKAEIEVTKAFEDWGKADSFTFNLAAVSEDAPMPASVTGIATKENPTVSFGGIEYEKTGTYEYTITEVNDGADGVTYDITPHNVVVTVTKDENNKMTAEVSYDDADSLIVTNTYASTKATIEATKAFEDWGKADSFTFNLAAVTADAPMPADTTAVATEADPTAVFGEITYEKAGTYEYTITEVNGGADGVTYDVTPHKVVVTVTKAEDETNALTAEVRYDGADSLIVTNTYTSTKATIEATKEFDDWGKADSFTFNLEALTEGAPMPENTTAVATEADPTAVFGEITYEKAGTYEYTITEVNDGADGVTYDVAPHKVVVTVTKAEDETNALTAEVRYDDADSLIITNTYTSTKAEIKATKQFNDWGQAESFTFNLAAVTEDAPMPENTTAVATKDSLDAVFGEIIFEKAGTYEYTITEVDDGVDGVTYDTAPHSVVVTVTKAEDETNALTAEVKYDGADSLIITNTFAGSKTTLQVTKAFSDWGKADSFTFNLAAVTEGAPMPENTTVVATKEAPTAVFGEVEYDKAGTYEYTITEVNDGVDGVSYDTTPHKVVVTVTKGEDNKLTAVAKYDDADSLVVTNTYASTKAVIEAEKNFNDWGKAASFTFNLAAVTEDAPMPANTTAIATEAAPKAVFGEITYEKAGTYEYTITEVNDGVDGVSYDTTPHNVVVTVTKAEDATNALTAEVKYDGVSSLLITNNYTSTKAPLEVTKDFADWGKADSFTFNLAAVTEGAPMPENTTAVATEAAPTAVFGEITYEKAGTYEYTITEVNDGADGVTYDVTPHKVVVTVTKAEDETNALTAEVKYDGADSLVVTNTYASTKAEIKATKQFNDWGKAESFTFNLAAVTEGAPMPENTTAVATKDAVDAVFGEIIFEKAGTYEYTITEVNDGVDGVTYDTAPHSVVVTVTKAEDATNALTAEVEYDGADSLIITNTFAGSKTTLQVTKEFNDWGKAEKFTFNLAAVTEGAPMPENTTAVATKNAPTAVFGEVEYDESGIYEYTITEVNDGVDGVSYDTTPHKVVVTVTKDENNKLTAVAKYDDADSLIITNTFTSTKAVIEATKEFNDWGKADSFTFILAAVTEGAPMPENTTAVATEEAPTAVFGEITYEKAGTYEYTITEVNDGADGVTYDTAPHSVVVTVTKAEDATNALTAEVKYDGADSLIITNTYTSTKAEIKATKQFNDWGKAESFTFNLAAVTEGAPMPESTTAVATKDAVDAKFGEITFEKAGTYEYTITEVNGGVDGVTYDTTPHSVVVTVTKADDATNALTAEVKYDGADSLIITNTFAGSKTTLQVTKAFSDWGKADSFTFNLAAVTKDAPMPENTTAVATEEAPTAVFGEVEYDKAGIYEYTITEVNDGADGVTYDTTPHKVVVTVTKDDDNKLTAVAKYDDADSLIVTNTYATTKAEIVVTKAFEDWGKADSFTFNLEAVTEGAPVPASMTAIATKENPRVSFGEIEYEKAGTYEYTVTEVNGGRDGVTYDITPHNVVVTVTKAEDATNALTAEVKYEGADSLIITNTYASTKATIEATKEFNDWGKADSFTFNLAAVTEGAPMPEDTTAFATEAAPTAVFGEIIYEETGTYEYTITEANGGADGVTYDTAPHSVVVTVTKAEDETNALTAEVKYEGADSLIITNTYASTKATIEATKEFNDWGKADSFTFNLAALTEDAPMPESTTAVATEAAPTAVFGEITYEKAGTYEYTITEVNDGADGVTYDIAPHSVVVTVTKAEDETNALTAEVKYDGADSLIITNTYTSTKAEIKATKQFNDWGKAESFTFNLAAVTEGAPMPESTTAVATKDAVDAKFGEITFEKAGTYEYTITEVNDGVDGVTYDTAPHSVVVTVTKAEDETNALTAEVKYDGADALVITNTFEGSKTTLQVTKAFNDWGKADSFTFNLEAVTEGAPMPESTTAIATEEAPTAVFGEVEYDKSGTYEYTITEVNDGVDGVTYDTTPHKVVVTVTKDENNKLTAVATYDDAESLIVTNTYTSTKAEIKATKEFNDWGKAASFTFDLAAVTEGAPMPANTKAIATKDAVTASFGEITFEKAGVYEYTITEENSGIPYVTYDTAAHKVVVTVTKADETNALTAEVKYDGAESLTITNKYEAKCELTITKTFAGCKVQIPSALSFTVTGPNGFAQTVNYTEFVNGSYTFKDLEPGTYTVTENNANVSGYVLTTAYAVNGTAVQKADVKLEPNVTGKVDITNKYHKEVTPTPSKSVKTGDTTNAAIPVATATLAMLVIAYILLTEKKRRDVK